MSVGCLFGWLGGGMAGGCQVRRYVDAGAWGVMVRRWPCGCRAGEWTPWDWGVLAANRSPLLQPTDAPAGSLAGAGAEHHG